MFVDTHSEPVARPARGYHKSPVTLAAVHPLDNKNATSALGKAMLDVIAAVAALSKELERRHGADCEHQIMNPLERAMDKAWEKIDQASSPDSTAG